MAGILRPTLKLAVVFCSATASSSSAPVDFEQRFVPQQHTDAGRQYSHIKLSNDLVALLIHDPHTPRVKVSVGIAAGSHHDPPGLEGLANVVQRAVQRGSAKFPELSSFIEHHAGHRAGFTNRESIVFSTELENTDDSINHFLQMY